MFPRRRQIALANDVHFGAKLSSAQKGMRSEHVTQCNSGVVLKSSIRKLPIRLRSSLAFKCGNVKTLQLNRQVFYLRDENNQQKRRFLCDKVQDVRHKQKEAKYYAADEISCRENCYCSTPGLTHFKWLIVVCGSLTRLIFLKIIISFLF